MSDTSTDFVPTRSRLGAHRVVAVVLGMLLLSTAGLKLWGAQVSPFAQYGWLHTPTVQIAVVVWEVVLGVWLVCGVYQVFAWWASVGTFASFAFVSGYLGWMGQANCGCFGTIQASPWYAFTLDIVALVLLVCIKPRSRATNTTPPHPFANKLVNAALTALVLFCALMAYGSWQYGSPGAALARMQGVAVYAPSYVDFGNGQAGNEIERSVEVSNWTQQPVRLIGGTSDCSCITTANMPLTIEPNQTVTLPIRLRPPSESKGTMSRWVELLTDCPQRRTIRLVVACRVS